MHNRTGKDASAVGLEAINWWFDNYAEIILEEMEERALRQRPRRVLNFTAS
jgi:hypothetical protein